MTEPENGVHVALVTCGNDDQATRLARALVERRLAACVNIVPGVRSVYRWEGKVNEDPEVLLVIKTTRDRLEALERAVGELHSYACPETIALPVTRGAARYLDWVVESTR